MRRIINQFKEPIYKDDLLNATIYGILHMVLFGILGGAIQYFLMGNFNASFSVVIYMVAYMIAKGIADKIYTYHILYSVMSVVLFLIGFLIYKTAFYAFATRDILNSFLYVFSWDGIKIFLFGFLNINTYHGISILYNIIDIIFFIFCLLTVWRLPKRRKWLY